MSEIEVVYSLEYVSEVLLDGSAPPELVAKLDAFYESLREDGCPIKRARLPWDSERDE